MKDLKVLLLQAVPEKETRIGDNAIAEGWVRGFNTAISQMEKNIESLDWSGWVRIEGGEKALEELKEKAWKYDDLCN